MGNAWGDDFRIIYQLIHVKFNLCYDSLHVLQTGKLLFIEKITFVEIVVVHMGCI